MSISPSPKVQVSLQTDSTVSSDCCVIPSTVDPWALLFSSNGAILVYDITDEDSFFKV